MSRGQTQIFVYLQYECTYGRDRGSFDVHAGELKQKNGDKKVISKNWKMKKRWKVEKVNKKVNKCVKKGDRFKNRTKKRWKSKKNSE